MLWYTINTLKNKEARMFEHAFKTIDDTLRNDAGLSTEMDYIEQTSWVLFLKYLSDLEEEKKTYSEINNTPYKALFDEKYRWESWAAPMKNGKIDLNALTGDDLMEFVNVQLMPYLKSFKNKAGVEINSLEYKIGEIFSEIFNRIRSGYNLRTIINKINELRFQSSEEKHELSSLYETKIKNMGNTGRNGGEYYTPRPLIKAIIKVVNPKIGETIYDGAAGSAGFLVEAFNYLRSDKMSTDDYEFLQTKTLFAQEKKPLPYIIGLMNMILHGIESPNFKHTNTLGEDVRDLQEKDRHHVILANPPFGASEDSGVQNNFTHKTSETASMFLQHFIKKLKAGGRAGIVIKNTFLSNGDNATMSIRKELLQDCNLHTILDAPAGVFAAGVRTVVLFFTKGEPTKNIWYYQLNLNRNLGKTNPLNEDDMSEFMEFQKNKIISENSWLVNINDLDENADLSVKNPNHNDEIIHRSPEDILLGIDELNNEITADLNAIRELL